MIHSLILRVQQLDRQHFEILAQYIDEVSSKKSESLLKQLVKLETEAKEIKLKLDNL